MKFYVYWLGVGIAGLTAMTAMTAMTGCSSSDGGSTGSTGSGTPESEAEEAAEAADDGPACAARAGAFGYAATHQDTTCGDSNGATAVSVEMFDVDYCKQDFCLGYMNLPAGKTTQVKDLLQGCEGTVTVSATNCTSKFSYTCEVKSLYGMVEGTTTVQYAGTVHWKSDGKGGEGSLKETFFRAPGSSICSKDFALDLTQGEGSDVSTPIPGAPGGG